MQKVLHKNIQWVGYVRSFKSVLGYYISNIQTVTLFYASHLEKNSSTLLYLTWETNKIYLELKCDMLYN